MGAVLQLTFEFWTTECFKCGTAIAMPKAIFKKREDDHQSFWCPMGHEQRFVGPSEADRLRTELESQKRETERQRNARAAAERDLKREQRKLKSVKRRIEAGVCIHCHRTVKQLAQHMKTKHPEVG